MPARSGSDKRMILINCSGEFGSNRIFGVGAGVRTVWTRLTLLLKVALAVPAAIEVHLWRIARGLGAAGGRPGWVGMGCLLGYPVLIGVAGVVDVAPLYMA